MAPSKLPFLLQKVSSQRKKKKRKDTPSPTPTERPLLNNIHQHSSSSASLSSTSFSSSRLLSLPTELLLQILLPLIISPFPVPLSLTCCTRRSANTAFLLLHPSYHHSCPWSFAQTPSSSSSSSSYSEYHRRHSESYPTTSIIFTCRQLYALCAPIYYSSNHFTISVPYIRRFTESFPTTTLSLITSLEVHLADRFLDWPLVPLLTPFKGLTRLLIRGPEKFPPPWNHFCGIVHQPGRPTALISRAGYGSQGDVLRGLDDEQKADISLGEEFFIKTEIETLILEHLPCLTGFSILPYCPPISRPSPRFNFSLSRAWPPSISSDEKTFGRRTIQDLDKQIRSLACERERRKNRGERGNSCRCKRHGLGREFCCKGCPLREWEVFSDDDEERGWGYYAPAAKPMKRFWSPPDPPSPSSLAPTVGGILQEREEIQRQREMEYVWDERFLEEDVWGLDNMVIMRERYFGDGEGGRSCWAFG